MIYSVVNPGCTGEPGMLTVLLLVCLGPLGVYIVPSSYFDFLFVNSHPVSPTVPDLLR